MAEPVPCPNHACSAVFTPESLRGATRFTCPRCGLIFQLRAAPEAKPSSRGTVAGRRSTVRHGDNTGSAKGSRPPDGARTATLGQTDPAAPETIPPSHTEARIPPKSAAKVVASPPTSPAAVPAAEPPAAEPPTAFQFTPEPEGGGIIARRQAPKRRRAWPVAAILLVAAAGGIAGGYAWLRSANVGGTVTILSDRFEGAYLLPAPGQDWKRDNELQLRMQVGRAYRRSQPAAALALLTRDYKTRLPSEGELVGEALARLRLLFKRVEWERSSAEARLGGQPALAVDFDATDAEEVDVRGTAYLLGYRGHGYWLFLWSPAADRDQAAAEADLVRGSFVLSPTFREGWQEKPPESEPLAVPAAAASLSYPKAVWVVEEKEGYDPKAVHVLKGSFSADASGRQRDWNASKVASAQVLVLPAAAGKAAGELAREYVLASQKDPDRGNYPQTTVKPIKNKSGEEQDRDADLGKLHGRLTKLQMANTEDRERFVVLGAVPRDKGRVLVVWCECDWAVRDYWEPEFATLLNSLRPQKDGGEARPAGEGKKAEKEAPVKEENNP
jgi:hypothetical protein